MTSNLHLEEVYSDWESQSEDKKIELFYSLVRDDQDELFLKLGADDQFIILKEASHIQTRTWLRALEPDDAVDLLQLMPEEARSNLVKILDAKTQHEVNALLAYRDDVAGGLMNTRFARLRPESSVDEALKYLRAQGTIETIYYAYVLSSNQKLLGVVSLRELFRSSPNVKVEEIMTKGEDVITALEGESEEQVAQLFSRWSFLALPVVDHEGHMKGILTVDDVVEVVQDVATEDIQKFGGMEALDAPYFQLNVFELFKKRAVWLFVLFIGELLTASAMGFFEAQIEKAVVLALFIPLIISSGGNSGSQASTLIIRAMALNEIKLSDWKKVFIRELSSGLLLGLFLGLIGLLRIVFWPSSETIYSEHYILVGFSVGFSLVGIVLWGTLAGSMLPFVLRSLRLDPATASAPFVATLVDVTGIILYFTIATIFLRGTLL